MVCRQAIRYVLVVGLILACGFVHTAYADPIPYPNPGNYNAVSYSFTAVSTGHVYAYYAGSHGIYENRIGLLDNGNPTGAGYGLDNYSSSIGDVFDLGQVSAGDSLIFVLDDISLGKLAYSDSSRNTSYDLSGDTVGHNHIYATEYTATSPIFAGIPTGTYVAFEDLTFPESDGLVA